MQVQTFQDTRQRNGLPCSPSAWIQTLLPDSCTLTKQSIGLLLQRFCNADEHCGCGLLYRCCVKEFSLLSHPRLRWAIFWLR